MSAKTRFDSAFLARVGFAIVLVLACEQLFARDIFIAVNGNDASAGTSSAPYKTIAKASSVAAAGDNVLIMPGRYNEVLRPARSGSAGKPITYRSGGSSPAIVSHGSARGLDIAIDINGKSHIVVEGINVDGVTRGPNARVNRFAVVNNASHVVIRRGNFKFANGWQGIHVTGTSSYVTIEYNTIDEVGQYDSGAGANSDTGDAIEVRGTSPTRVLIQGNVIKHSAHNLISIKANNVIVQDNVLDNTYRDTIGGNAGGRAGTLMGSDNVFQRNYVTGAGASSDNAANVLLKVEGVNNIARNNVFAYGAAEALLSESASWTPNTTDSRIYNNTFYRLSGGAWRVRSYTGGSSIGRSVFANNLVMDSRMQPPASSENADMISAVATANVGALANNKLLGNLWGPSGSQAPRVNLTGFNGMIDMTVAQTLYPALIANNRQARATFVSGQPKALRDFDLSSGSAGIDQGIFLTTTTAAGNSARLPVSDRRFFSTGLGLVPGDTIQLKGSTVRARVVNIDAGTNVLVLDKTVQFTSGQSVALAYEGSAPDVGAREFGAPRKLSPPTAVSAR